MSDFTKKELWMSLVCPIITFIYGAFQIISDLAGEVHFEEFYKGHGCFRLSYFAAILVGGLLPAALTCFGKIHTEQYLKKRLAVIGVTALAATVVNSLLFNAVIAMALLILFGTAAIVYQMRNVYDDAFSNAERAVLLLSDPIVYFTIKYVINLCGTLIYSATT